MAHGTPFLFPVVVDDTRESAALVPEQFLRVQWTRLPAGEVPTDFAQRVRSLLSGGPERKVERPRAEKRDEGVASPEKANTARFPRWSWVALAAVAIISFVALQSLRHPASVTSSAPSAAKPPLDLAAAKSIAVLPFENRSAEKENEFFTDGVHDNILTSLTNIGQLQVVSRTSVMEYRGTKKKIPQIARELNVAYVLEGSVQRDGRSVRITGQLIRAATDEHIWAKNFDRELSTASLFAIQSELAQAIAGELKAAISPSEIKLIERRPTENPAAYDLLLKARALETDFEEAALGGNALRPKREVLLLAAVQLDPMFASAWADLARSHVNFIMSNADTTADRQAKAKAALDRATSLDPESPDVIRALVMYYRYGRPDRRLATEQVEKLLRVAPNDAIGYRLLSADQSYDGRYAEALANAQKARKRFGNFPAILREGLEREPDNTRLIRYLATIEAVLRVHSVEPTLPRRNGNQSVGRALRARLLLRPSNLPRAERTAHLRTEFLRLRSQGIGVAAGGAVGRVGPPEQCPPKRPRSPRAGLRHRRRERSRYRRADASAAHTESGEHPRTESHADVFQPPRRPAVRGAGQRPEKQRAALLTNGGIRRKRETLSTLNSSQRLTLNAQVADP
ncbi:MAG: hypothetical protein EXS37_05930 [Opitutus sp.]|nr:hypothetical protein [Opitutus sp.]